jgi:hypothetical protein
LIKNSDDCLQKACMLHGEISLRARLKEENSYPRQAPSLCNKMLKFVVLKNAKFN